MGNKRAAGVGIAIFLFANTALGNAATDNTPPTIEVSMPEKAQYCQNEWIRFQFIIRDDFSGISRMPWVLIRDKEDYLTANEMNTSGQGFIPNGEVQSKLYIGGTYQSLISEWVKPGVYWIWVGVPQDIAGNWGDRSKANGYYQKVASITVLDSDNSVCVTVREKAAAEKAAIEKAAIEKAAADKAAADKEAADKAAAVQAAEEKAALDRYIALSKAAEEEAKTKTKEKSIICLKGKSTKKLTGKSPKCPAGYKVKK